jgi:cysteinyl-tRNA synthetase
MSLRVYNTLSKQKEPFDPVRPGKVGIYLCGPTVYKPPHLGHMVGPVIFDAIKRYLQYKGYDVSWIVNITDVDDKIIDRAAELKVPWTQVAETSAKEYHECLALLGVETIDRFPKASAHMAEIVAMCQELVDKGFAYPAEGSLWFDVAKDPDYGKLSHRKVEEQEAGTRELTGSGKRNPADFALWKAAKPGEPAWDSPWGPGRPGWHIECSAMSIKYLGETFDNHGGGLDLMFPHHENELAQSESVTGKTFAKYWLHNGLTRVATKVPGGQLKTEKMSKSIGNVIDPKEIVAEHGVDLVRYLILSTHYRRPIDFSDEVIATTKKGMGKFLRLFERVERLAGAPVAAAPDLESISSELLESEHASLVRPVLNLKMKFLETMDDDFNTAGAIGVLHELADEVNSFIERSGAERDTAREKSSATQSAARAAAAATKTLRGLAGLLGLFRQPAVAGATTTQTITPQKSSADVALTDSLMNLIIQLRQMARQKKDFQIADAVRNGLGKLGITLEDRPEGTGWRKQ